LGPCKTKRKGRPRMGHQISFDLDDGMTIDLRLARAPRGPSTTLPALPFVDLAATHEPLIDEILLAWEQILRTSAFTGGPAVEEFESEFARYVGAENCVAVGSGTDALVLSLRAMGLKSGDEVITVPHTFIATAQSIIEAGGRPVFVDVDPNSGTIDPGQIESAITSRTRVLLPVHLYGQPADMDPVLDICDRYGLQVLEDAAQAHGARYRNKEVGSMGVGAFSFYPSKNLGACGSGGAVTTDDAALANRIRMLSNHGETKKNVHHVGGVNSRLDALQAAALRIKLRHLDGWVVARRHWASRYDELLADTELEVPTERADSTHAYHLYVVRHPSRDWLRSELGRSGIETGIHYPIPVHLQGAFRHLGIEPGRFPNAERWASRGLSLPMYPELTEEAVARVSTALTEALRPQRVPAQHTA